MINGLRLDVKGMIDIPPHIKRIKFDVGLSWDAPNSAMWLTREKDLFVIGIEPNRYATDLIKERGEVWSMVKRGDRVVITEDNYMLLECAIGNVDEPVMMPFNSMSCTSLEWAGCPGCSSLLEPTVKLLNDHQEVSSTDEVMVVPFKYLLEKIPWDRFPYIDMVKTDCQGIDMEVIKSMGEYLERVVYLNCEISAVGWYEGATDPNEFISFLNTMGFDRNSKRNGGFSNGQLKDVARVNKISNRCRNL